jgi:hypothetical protein
LRNLAFLLILLQVIGVQAFAQSNAFRQRFKSRISQVQAILAAQNSAQAQQGSSNECLQRYDRLFNDSELSISLNLGYYDSSPGDNVFDIDLDREITNMLVAPCSSNQSACGFKQARMDIRDLMAKSFVKTILGPDKKSRTLRVKLFHASENQSASENRTDFNQTFRSNQAEYDFRTALKSADIVFYMGHSRDGGGPDFDPPKVLPDGHVDYNWYHHNKTDFKELLNDLSSTSTPPKLLGLLSCYSNMHFANAIRRASPKTGLLVSLNEIGDGQMFEGLLTVINGVQRFKCEQQLASDLDAANIDKTKVGNRQKSLLEFRNFPPR